MVGIGSAGAGASGSTLSGDISLIITLLTFPLTIFSLYYKNQDRRGLRPLLVYIPGGLMMCQYVILTSISEHVASQVGIYDSKRLYDFTFWLQITGIVITVVSNLWNASADVTIMNWLRNKGYLDREFWAQYCCCCKDAEEEKTDGAVVPMDDYQADRLSTTFAKSSAADKRAPWKKAQEDV